MAQISPDDLIFNEELRNLFPPLSPEAISKMEASLEREKGALVPVWAWMQPQVGPVLVDGYNRVSGCRKLGKPFKVQQVFQDATTIEEVKHRLRLAQVGRRNLSSMVEAYNIGQIVQFEVKAKGTQVSNAVKDIAKDTGASERQIWRAYDRAQATDALSVDPNTHLGLFGLAVVELKQLAKLAPEMLSDTLERIGNDAGKIKKELRTFSATKGNPLYDAEQAKARAKSEADAKKKQTENVFKTAQEHVGRAGSVLEKLKSSKKISSKEFEQAYAAIRLVDKQLSDWKKRAESKD